MQSFTVRADIVNCGIPGLTIYVTPCLGYTTWEYGDMVLCKKLSKSLTFTKHVAPFPLVGSFQLKISQVPVPFLYFFSPPPTPYHASLPHHSADTPLQTIPSLLHTTTNPCYLLEQQLPLKCCTKWKKL